MTDREILLLITEVCPIEDSDTPMLLPFQVVKVVRAALNKVTSSQPISGHFLTHEEIDTIRDKGWWDGYRQINKPKEK